MPRAFPSRLFSSAKSRSALSTYRFNQESRAAARWLAPTKHEHHTREMLVDLILDTIKREFRNDAPQMQIEPFGSHVNELYLPGG